MRRLPLIAAVLLAGCDVGPATNSSPANISQATPFDIQTIVERANNGYRRDVNTNLFSSDRPLLSIRAGEGIVRITARHAGGELEAIPFSLETVAIARDRAYDLGVPETRIGPDASLVIARGVAEEQFVNRDANTEQSWRFDTRPEGQGDLIIHVATAGLAYAGWSESGHHFIDQATELGLLYGPAKWIDGAGSVTPIEVQFVGEELVLTVPGELVDRSIYPAVLDPVIFPQFALYTAQTGPSGHRDEAPAVAFDGNNFLAVWADQRNGENFDIYGARVSPAGALVDSVSLPIATDDASSEGYNQLTPAIAFDGTNYLVVWSADEFGLPQIRGSIIAPSGAAVVSDFFIAPSASSQLNPAVAVDAAGDFVVAWQDLSGAGENIAYAAVDGMGGTVAPATIFEVGGAPERNPAIACGTTNCLVVWQDGATAEDIHGVRVTTAGAIDATPLVITAENGRDLRPDLAFDSTNANYMVVWGRTDISAKRVAQSDGSLLDATPIRISNGPSSERSPAIAFDGTQFFVAWQDGRLTNTALDIFGARVSTAGVVTDVAGIQINAQAQNQMLPAIAFGGSRFFVVWEDYRTGRSDVFYTRVSTTGAIQDGAGVFLSRAQLRQTVPTVIHDGNFYVVVFAAAERTGVGVGNHNNIRLVRVNNNGVILDPGTLQISGAINNQSAPKIAFGGGQFLIVWADFRNGTDYDVFGARLNGTPTYSLIDVAGIPISTGTGDQTLPAVAYNASSNNYLVVWQDRRNGTDFDVRGARVEFGGGVTDGNPGLSIGVAIRDQRNPSVASSGSNWLVAWSDQRLSATPDTEDIFGAVVDTAGGVGTNETINAEANVQGGARVIHDGTQYLVVWSDTRASLFEADIYGRNVDNAGTPLGASAGTALVTGPESTSGAAIARAGNQYFMIWKQSTAVDGANDIFGQRFTFGLAPVDAVPFAISQEAGNENEISLAARNEFNTLLVYSMFDGAPAVGAVRVFARRVTFP